MVWVSWRWLSGIIHGHGADDVIGTGLTATIIRSDQAAEDVCIRPTAVPENLVLHNFFFCVTLTGVNVKSVKSVGS